MYQSGLLVARRREASTFASRPAVCLLRISVAGGVDRVPEPLHAQVSMTAESLCGLNRRWLALFDFTRRRALLLIRHGRDAHSDFLTKCIQAGTSDGAINPPHEAEGV